MKMIVMLIMLWELQVLDAMVTEEAVEREILDAIVMKAATAQPEGNQDATSTQVNGIFGNTVTMKLVYCSSIVGMGIFVIALYWRRSTAVIIRIMCYLFALCFIKISVRHLFEEYKFEFPTFLTALHFLTSGLLCCVLLMCAPTFSANRRHAVPSWSCMLCKILPMSLVFASSIAAGNAALVYASTSFVEMMSSSTPVCTVVVALVFNQPFHKRLMLPVLLVCAGLALCVSGAIQFSLMGLVFSLLATLLRSVKAVLQQVLMTGEKAAFEPVELLAWLTIPSVLVMLSWSLVTEGSAPYARISEACSESGSYHLLLSIGLTCINACILNVFATFIVKDLGAVGAQLTGQLKGVLTVLGGMAILHETVYVQQAAGYILVSLGILWYTNMDAGLKAQEKESHAAS